MKNCRLPCQVGTDVSGVEAGTGVDIRVRDRPGLHAERRDALGCNKRNVASPRLKRRFEFICASSIDASACITAGS